MLTIVSGLSSLGKYILLEALKAGGVKIIDDRISNIDKGETQDLFEYEKIEQIANNNLWFEPGENWAVSLVSVLLKRIPLTYNYNVIFIERNIEDIIRDKENIFAGIITSNENVIQDGLKKAFIEIHSNRVKRWLNKNRNFNTILINYDDLIENPAKIISEIDEKLRLAVNIEESVAVMENNRI